MPQYRIMFSATCWYYVQKKVRLIPFTRWKTEQEFGLNGLSDRLRNKYFLTIKSAEEYINQELNRYKKQRIQDKFIKYYP